MSTERFEMCLLRAATTEKIGEVKLVSINSHGPVFLMCLSVDLDTHTVTPATRWWLC